MLAVFAGIAGLLLRQQDSTSEISEAQHKRAQPGTESLDKKTGAEGATRSLAGTPAATAATGLARPPVDEQKLAELIDRHISPSMRMAINELLRPGDRDPEILQRDGRLVVDTSDRSATVMVGIIDEEHGLVITDFTHPLPMPGSN